MKTINEYNFMIFCVLLSAIQHVTGTDFLSHTVRDIEGNDVHLEQYRGNAILVVNVASECGFTDKHYKQMVKAFDIFGKTGKFNILAFPCNQFSNQEPKENEEILKFAKETYGVQFPMFAKIEVKGDKMHPAWEVLTDEGGEAPGWNFFKYLIDHTGKVIGHWGPWSDLEEIWHRIRSAVDDAVDADGATSGTRPQAPAPPREPSAQPRAPATSSKEPGPPLPAASGPSAPSMPVASGPSSPTLPPHDDL